MVVDLPFLTYQVSIEEAIRNAGRVLAETGAKAVKLEGGATMAPTVRALVERGHPGGGAPRAAAAVGAGARAATRCRDARRRRPSSWCATPGHWRRRGPACWCSNWCRPRWRQRVTKALAIPTVGIGAGAGCDGQVLVLLRPARPQRPLQPELPAEVRRPVEWRSRAAVAAFGEEVRAAEVSRQGAQLRVMPGRLQPP